MSKTIVNIIDKSNPMPAYLFTKEYYAEGDNLLFISTEEEDYSRDGIKHINIFDFLMNEEF